MTSNPGAYPSASSPVVAPTIDPRAAALLAAEARSRQPVFDPHAASTSASAHSNRQTIEFNPSAADKLPFHRLLDTELMPKCSIPQRVKTLETLLTITSNILRPPQATSSSKFRQLRMNNSMIVRNIMEVNGAYDYLIACGFRKSIEQFVPYLTFSPAPTPKQLHSLRVGNHVLSHVVTTARAAEERSLKFREDEKAEEAKRVGRAMLGFEEDRRLKREKDDRDKQVRDARARMAAEGEYELLQAINPDRTIAPPALLSAPSTRAGDFDDEMDGGSARERAEEEAYETRSELRMMGVTSDLRSSTRVLGTGETVAPEPVTRHGAGSGGRGRKREQMDESEEGDL